MANALTKAEAGYDQTAKSDQGYDTPVETLVEWFEDAAETTDNARKLAERDRDYYDNKQLTPEEIKTLADRSQPEVIKNRIQRKVDYLLGFEASNRTDPKAMPRNPEDDEAGEAGTDALRYLEDVTDFDQVKSCVWQYMLIEGFGGAELVIEDKNGKPEITVKEWDWDRLFYDPHSRKPDFSDARYLGGVIWMDCEEAKEKWPDAVEAIERTVADATAQRTYDDRPTWKTWASGKARKRVRIVQMYHKAQGKWQWCIFTKGGKIEGGEVPFVDQDGQSWCPLMLQSAYVDRQNNRYGAVRQMIGSQDEINKRSSKLLWRTVARQSMGEVGAIDDVDLMKAELAKPDGHAQVNPGFKFEILDQTEQTQIDMLLLQEAKQEIDLLGPNAAMAGKDAQAPSGKAIQLSQMGGQTELSYLLDRHRHWKRRMYRGMWNLVRQYWTDERWVRVTDNDENIKFVGFNRPLTFAEEAKRRLEKQGMPPEQVDQLLQQAMGDPIRSQQMQQVVRMENVPSEMDMDITIEEVPDVSTTAEEQFTQLVNLAPAVVFPPEVYIKASSLRNKKEIIETMNGAGQDPAEREFAQKQAEQALAKGQAEIDKLMSEAALNMARAEKEKLPEAPAQPEGPQEDPATVAIKADAEKLKAIAGVHEQHAHLEAIELGRVAKREEHAMSVARMKEQAKAAKESPKPKGSGE